jgi:hypothetical protein
MTTFLFGGNSEGLDLGYVLLLNQVKYLIVGLSVKLYCIILKSKFFNKF